MTDMYNPAGWTVAEHLEASRFDNVAVSLVDLHRTRLRRNEMNLQGIEFNGCRIEGPAVMLVLGGCTFEGVNFSASRGMDTLILRPASKSGVVGAIPVQNCSFRDCIMVGIGFTGPDAFLDQLLAVGGPQ